MDRILNCGFKDGSSNLSKRKFLNKYYNIIFKILMFKLIYLS